MGLYQIEILSLLGIEILTHKNKCELFQCFISI